MLRLMILMLWLVVLANAFAIDKLRFDVQALQRGQQHPQQ